MGAVDLGAWQREVARLIAAYKRANGADAATLLGRACRLDPRLFTSHLVRDQLLLWLLERAEGAVKRDLSSVHLAPSSEVIQLERRQRADAAHRDLRLFMATVAAPPRRTHVAAELFVRVYHEVQTQVWEARLERSVQRHRDAASVLRHFDLRATNANVISIDAALGVGEEITLREVAYRFGIGVTLVRRLRDALIPGKVKTRYSEWLRRHLATNAQRGRTRRR